LRVVPRLDFWKVGRLVYRLAFEYREKALNLGHSPLLPPQRCVASGYSRPEVGFTQAEKVSIIHKQDGFSTCMSRKTSETLGSACGREVRVSIWAEGIGSTGTWFVRRWC
jgi:hypothetical protein